MAKRSRFLRNIGFALIILTWIFWAVIFIIPFLKLGVKLSAILITALLIGTNAFWIGAAILGKEYMQKYQVWPKIKAWFRRKKAG